MTAVTKNRLGTSGLEWSGQRPVDLVSASNLAAEPWSRQPEGDRPTAGQAGSQVSGRERRRLRLNKLTSRYPASPGHDRG